METVAAMVEISARHHSQKRRYRRPFGALPSGETAVLSIDIAAAAPSLRVFLRLRRDDGTGEVRLPLSPAGKGEGGVRFSAEIGGAETEEPGLLWYDFLIEAGEDLFYYGAKPGATGGEGVLSREEGSPYQITVFRPWALPDWYRRAIFYQIFVDRFYRSGKTPPPPGRGRGPKRLFHLDWDDDPFYLKDGAGHVTHWDFFGGDLAGIEEKLRYLRSLGIGGLYLNPIFEAASNHKYDTGDYHAIDPGFGGEEDFRRLVQKGEEQGMRLILDGVFSHTGADSRYFNLHGHYPEKGAYQGTDSPYFPWYRFISYPDAYESWWNVRDLPNVNEDDESYRRFVFGDGESVLRHWLDAGAKGWRLDVADELPEAFIRDFRRALKAREPEAVLIGEVWEDASHKISYGQRRGYLLGDSLDGVTHYPLRQCWFDFVLGERDGDATTTKLLSLWENYPAPAVAGSLTLLGSHDTERVRTLVEAAGAEEAPKRLQLLFLLQMTFPGVPCIYYGDEAGLRGGKDPDNRRPFPWGREDREILDWVRRMTKLRQENPLFSDGEMEFLPGGDRVLAYRRHKDGEEIHVIVNAGGESAAYPPLPGPKLDLLSGKILTEDEYVLPPFSALVLTAPGPEIRLPRRAGILLPVASLPGSDGCGDFGMAAYDFIDFLAAAGQSLWQILPLNPTGQGFSPYDSPGAFAKNPLFLAGEGRREAAGFALDHCDYEGAAEAKEKLGRAAFQEFREDGAFDAYRRENHFWLEDYCLFQTLKKEFSQAPWQEWPQAVARREEKALAHYRRQLEGEIRYQRFLQFSLDRQWRALKAYANGKGVAIFGDLPLYVAADSADVWARPSLFLLDEEGYPALEAGVPPDDFAVEGQGWGHPIYDWQEMERDGFLWWRERIAAARRDVDFLRLDHFRGFEAYWGIEPGQKAAAGSWYKGPGQRFFTALNEMAKIKEWQEKGGPPTLIGEDLGFLTPEVEVLKRRFGIPGMGIYQFSGAEAAGGRHALCYTGSHDNETLLGWYRRLHPAATALEAEEACAGIIAGLYRAEAPWVIVPIQDLFYLDNRARINVPGSTENNWRFRLDPRLPFSSAARRLQKIVTSTERRENGRD